MSFLLVTTAAVIGLAAYAGRAVYRQRRRRKAEGAMRLRLEATYPEADEGPETLPLHGPPGRVAVDGDGLLLRFGPEGTPAPLRRVPWSALRQVVPIGGGRVGVHVAHVGEIVVPGSLGRQLWDGTGKAAGGRGGAERARAARV